MVRSRVLIRSAWYVLCSRHTQLEHIRIELNSAQCGRVACIGNGACRANLDAEHTSSKPTLANEVADPGVQRVTRTGGPWS